MTDPQPTPPPSTPRMSSGSYATTGQLEARHKRTILGIIGMVVGVLFGGVQIALQVYETIAAVRAGRPIPTPSIIEIVYEYGFPVLVFFCCYALYSRDAAADVVSWVKSFIPGKG